MKKKPPSEQVLVGSYRLGVLDVDLYWVRGERFGGVYYSRPETGRCPRIKIGMQGASWEDVVAVLIHEAMEFTVDLQDRLFQPLGADPRGSDDRVVMLTHAEFSRVCYALGGFLTKALPDLAKVVRESGRKT